MTGNYSRAFFFLMLAAAVILAAGLGLRDPWPADEPRFALIARDMVESGNWLLPKVGGVLYPDKPPLHFWSVAVLYALTGSLRFSFLFPAFLAGLGTLALVVDLGRRLWGEQAGLWGGAVLLSLIQFPLQMKSGQLDAPLCFWTTLALYGMCRHLLLGPDWQWYALGGAAAGFGIITKGVGFLPYLVFLPFAIAVHRDRALPRLHPAGWRWAIAPLLTLAAVSLWLVPMFIATGAGNDPALMGYRDNILFHQTVTRYADAWGHIKPPWYLLTNAVPWLWLPATLLLPWLAGAWWRDLAAKRNTGLLLLLGWVVLVLLFFSISDGKRSVYIFPAAPAFAMIVGCYMPALATTASIRRVVGVFAPALGLLLAATAMYGLMNPHEIQEWLPNTTVIIKGMLSLLAMGSVAVVVGIATYRRRPFQGAATTLIMFWLGLSLLVAPQINTSRSGEGLVASAIARLGPDQDLALVGWPEQFLLYVDRPVTHFGYRRDVRDELSAAIDWLADNGNRRILVAEQPVANCLDPGSSVEKVGRAHRRDWLLLRGADLVRDCVGGGAADNGTQFTYRRPGRRLYGPGTAASQD